MSKEELFGGEPVITFNHEADRRDFLRWAGVIGAGAALIGAGTVYGSTSAGAAAPRAAGFGSGDIGILNYALTLEYLESTFYTMGVAKGLLKGRDLELVTPIRSHEDQHVAALTAAIKSLNSTPVSKPAITFPSGTFASADSFLKTASTFEEVGVTAYHGQVPLIKSVALLGAAASIAGVESRHAAILAHLVGGNPFPAPVEAHRTMSQVVAIVKPYL